MFQDTSLEIGCEALFNFALDPFQSYGLFIRRKVHIKNIKVKEGEEKNPTHIWKIADTR